MSRLTYVGSGSLTYATGKSSFAQATSSSSTISSIEFFVEKGTVIKCFEVAEPFDIQRAEGIERVLFGVLSKPLEIQYATREISSTEGLLEIPAVYFMEYYQGHRCFFSPRSSWGFFVGSKSVLTKFNYESN